MVIFSVHCSPPWAWSNAPILTPECLQEMIRDQGPFEKWKLIASIKRGWKTHLLEILIEMKWWWWWWWWWWWCSQLKCRCSSYFKGTLSIRCLIFGGSIPQHRWYWAATMLEHRKNPVELGFLHVFPMGTSTVQGMRRRSSLLGGLGATNSRRSK